ncbi:nucleotide sugar dehydrogenase [Belliella kenyensis]|uniref:Nucleotide sugar dehydrogenase n=1 Tax=Belliella kenyensis TaxID=1472724 RepID=A0ABV8EIK3_9BACT|nr:nucleotide sugar dehydrogenase [Belliella kenyensis]MCH7401719.1 nucleotide sugar dehydrogenase [Belliella kenyensis]MDN3604219.1 nucleotide sugar dehydrogenase [Belliella kenyensis]
MLKSLSESTIAIIGLGYVGLPLAVAFAEKYRTIGYDIDSKRVRSLQDGHDKTMEVTDEELQRVLVHDSKNSGQKSQGLLITAELTDIEACNIYIVTVPTPTDKHNKPVLSPMLKASEAIAKVLKRGDVVIYESTVYPGVTEEECVPVLEFGSGLRYNEDFFAGYSPERINPGDKEHTVTRILKVTSGSTEEVAEYVDQLYKSVISAGTYKASSIKVAEAAKVIENSQRDINIAFVNELSKIFNLLGIDTQEVLEAAGTKWNFLPFRPGLVGGHCIGVDPFYLAQKAQEVGYHPEIILAGRRLNDSMGKHVATETIKHMMRKDLKVIDSKVLILGFTFKEDCPDVRNSRVIDIYNELQSFDMDVEIYDPWADPSEVNQEYGIEIVNGEIKNNLQSYSAIILAVGHREFKNWDLKTSEHQVIFDVKSILPKEFSDARL